MPSNLPRIGAALIVCATAIVMIGPYGLWPAFEPDADQASSIASSIDDTKAAPSAAPAATASGTTGTPVAEPEPALPVVVANSPAATVIGSPSADPLAMTNAHLTEQAGLRDPAIAKDQSAKAIAKPVLQTTVSTPVDGTLPVDHAKDRSHQPARHDQAKARSGKSGADSDWALRLVYNRGG